MSPASDGRGLTFSTGDGRLAAAARSVVVVRSTRARESGRAEEVGAEAVPRKSEGDDRNNRDDRHCSLNEATHDRSQTCQADHDRTRPPHFRHSYYVIFMHVNACPSSPELPPSPVLIDATDSSRQLKGAFTRPSGILDSGLLWPGSGGVASPPFISQGRLLNTCGSLPFRLTHPRPTRFEPGDMAIHPGVVEPLAEHPRPARRRREQPLGHRGPAAHRRPGPAQPGRSGARRRPGHTPRLAARRRRAAPGRHPARVLRSRRVLQHRAPPRCRRARRPARRRTLAGWLAGSLADNRLPQAQAVERRTLTEHSFDLIVVSRARREQTEPLGMASFTGAAKPGTDSSPRRGERSS